ncbi:hypothetical protein [Anaeromyxobacter oryzisoli]|uniref:hypothetical protein n=1 Tax=Anaeromyxobacter oryzisoli TaxID=2925408 RepID=UPI001F5AADF1|nr:hypothetical protein [Anaeromyxobacter sp. SG63]
MTNLELPFGNPTGAELDALLREIDDALDACFLSELDGAFSRAAEARDAAAPAPTPASVAA